MYLLYKQQKEDNENISNFNLDDSINHRFR